VGGEPATDGEAPSPSELRDNASGRPAQALQQGTAIDTRASHDAGPTMQRECHRHRIPLQPYQ
jgi:hypothetical protein